MMSPVVTFGSHQSHASAGLWAVTATIGTRMCAHFGCNAVLVTHGWLGNFKSSLPRCLQSHPMKIETWSNLHLAFTTACSLHFVNGDGMDVSHCWCVN